MLTVGDKFPRFSLKATVSEDLHSAFETISNDSLPGQMARGVLLAEGLHVRVSRPRSRSSAERARDFADRDAQVLGASVDSEFVHLAWRKDHKDLRGLPFPMLADMRKDLSKALGVLDEEGVAKRATFLVDPQGVIRFVSVTDMNVGRNVNEVLRVLDALQTDELCPCNWQPGQADVAGGVAQSGAAENPSSAAPPSQQRSAHGFHESQER